MPNPPLSIARRTELLAREELAEPMRAAGFRKRGLVFTRRHGALSQVVQLRPSVLVSGGKSPPVGRVMVWVGCDGRRRAPSTESACAVHFRLSDVCAATCLFDVPLTRGPKREQVGAQLRAGFEALRRALDELRTLADVHLALSRRR